MTLLGNHDQELTAEERAAIADEARPGVWVQDEREPVIARTDVAFGVSIQFRNNGDGRALEQQDTDTLIVVELLQRGRNVRDWSLVAEACGRTFHTMPDGVSFGEFAYATEQRGGIHSDPLVRLLAFRAWGDRDRRWFETTAVFGFQPGDPTPAVMHASHVLTLVAYHGDRGTLMSSFTCSCGTVFQLR